MLVGLAASARDTTLNLFHQLQRWARTLKRDTVALYLAARDPRVPWYAKVVAACVAAYALSPIDLIPDFIPVVGYLDDVILVPLGIAFAIRLIPPALFEEHRQTASARAANRPTSRIGAAIIIVIWMTLLALSVAWIARHVWSL
jgi:uncharacterized membrane protein YkvA (DUF1232 family)